MACIRELGATKALVHASRIYLQKGQKWVRYFTPDALHHETIAFDRGGSFEPGKYELHPMPPTLREGAFAKRYATAATKKEAGVKKRGKHKVARRRITPDVRNSQGFRGDVKTPGYVSRFED